MPRFEGHNGSPGGSLYIYVDYTVGSYSISTNQTPVTMTMYLKHGSLYVSAGTNDCKMYAGGQTYSWTGPNFNTGPGTTKLGSHTFNVPHNADGTWSGTIGGEYKLGINYDGVYVGWITGSQKVTLPTIPRASDFSVSSVKIGSGNTVSINRASSSFTHTVTLKLGTRSVTASNAGSSATISPPKEWCNGITSATSATGTMTVDTYNGGSKIGSKSKSVTILVPDDVKPSVTLTKSIVDGFGGYCLQSRSKVRLQSSGSGVYGSTIKSYSVSGAGYSSSSSDYTTGVFNTAGTKTFTVTVTDSRGRTGTTSTNVLVEPYSYPSITVDTLCRCDSAGVPTESGKYVRVQASFLYTTFGSSSTTNTLKYHEISYRERGASSFTGHTTIENGVAKTVFGGALDARKEYEIHIYIEDTVGGKASSITTISSSANYLIAAKQNCMGLLKYPDTSKTGVQVGGDLRADGTIYCDTLSASNGFQPMWLPDGQDLNKVVNSGFYRLSDSVVNGPYSTCGYSQLIVSRGSDTISQILMPYSWTGMYIRSGNPADVGGTGSWNNWHKVVVCEDNTGTINSSASRFAITHKNISTGNQVSFGIDGGGTNRGIYDEKTGWIIQRDSNNNTVINSPGYIYFKSPQLGNNWQVYGANRVLWTGDWYMKAGQELTMSQPVSAQPNGIVLVFREYNPNTAKVQNSCFHTYFVPKQVVADYPHVGHSISWADFDGSRYITKYLYIANSIITGHLSNEVNNVKKSPSGITVSSMYSVLHKVIGV